MKKSSVIIDMDKVRNLTERRLWSWAELSRKAAVSVATIYSLQTGRRNASILTIRKLANALGVEPSEIVKEEQP